MEAENKLYPGMHTGAQGQPSQYPPQYMPTAPQGPPQGYPPNPGAPYLAPSGAVYGGGYGAAPLPPQHQQVTVVAATRPPPVVYVSPTETYLGAIVYACIVTWFCNLIFGIIAFFLAASAHENAATDPRSARRLGRASYIVSTAGIFVTILIVIIVCLVVMPGICRYRYDDICYRYKDCYGSYYGCESKGGVYHGGCCYWN